VVKTTANTKSRRGEMSTKSGRAYKRLKRQYRKLGKFKTKTITDFTLDDILLERSQENDCVVVEKESHDHDGPFDC
jgi:hypothetical protein